MLLSLVPHVFSVNHKGNNNILTFHEYHVALGSQGPTWVHFTFSLLDVAHWKMSYTERIL